MGEQASPIKIKKIGHVVLSVSDIERSSKFWTEIMGFKFSDRNENGMVFFRNATDHHTVALIQATEKNQLPKRGQVGFDHMALEVASVSELFKIRDFLRSNGVEIFYEGRRGPGGNPGIEFYDPDVALSLCAPSRCLKNFRKTRRDTAFHAYPKSQVLRRRDLVLLVTELLTDFDDNFAVDLAL